MNIAPTSPPSTQDAIEVLRSNHRRLAALFAEYDRSTSDTTTAADRNGLLARIGALLRAHLQMATELFYPPLRLSPDELNGLLDAHARLLKNLEQLAAADARTEDFDKRVADLGRQVREHLAGEEEKLFPRADSLDLKELGTRLAMRRGELMGDQGAD